MCGPRVGLHGILSDISEGGGFMFGAQGGYPPFCMNRQVHFQALFADKLQGFIQSCGAASINFTLHKTTKIHLISATQIIQRIGHAGLISPFGRLTYLSCCLFPLGSIAINHNDILFCFLLIAQAWT